MDIRTKLPWYRGYICVLEEKQYAKRRIVELKNPEKQLQRTKKFYENLGADFSQNYWIYKKEEDMGTSSEKTNRELLHQERMVKFADIVDNAVKRQDEESRIALSEYKNDALFYVLVRQIMFYIGISMTKRERKYVIAACKVIIKEYPPEDTEKFEREGQYYYLYYLRCLRHYLKNQNEGFTFDEAKQLACEQCLILRGALEQYKYNTDIGYAVGEILKNISWIERTRMQ